MNGPRRCTFRSGPLDVRISIRYLSTYRVVGGYVLTIYRTPISLLYANKPEVPDHMVWDFVRYVGTVNRGW